VAEEGIEGKGMKESLVKRLEELKRNLAKGMEMLAAGIRSVEDGVADLGAKFGLGFDDDRE